MKNTHTTDLIAEQPEGEARYQAAFSPAESWLCDLRIGPSQMTPDQPMVQAGYGNEHLGLAQGSGGLSAAAVDLARLPAILLDPSDNPVLLRSTITELLELASIGYALYESLLGSAARAGFGFDSATSTGGQFHVQKGGLVENASSGLQIKDGWGFVALWGSTIPNGNWYPDWPEAISAAQATSWGNVDLFPSFGMRSLATPVAAAADATGVYLTDSYGTLTQFSGDGTGNWASERITDSWFAPLGAVVTAGPEPGNVFLFNSEGYLDLLSPQGGGTWNLPLPITLSAAAPPGAGVAVVPLAGSPGRTDALFVDLNGTLNVSSVTGGGLWSAPQPISGQAFAPPGAAVTACQQLGVTGRTVAFVVGKLGQVCVFANVGGQWSGPTPISAKNFAQPGACVAASAEYGTGNQTDVFVVGSAGYLFVFFAQGSGSWSGPNTVSNQRLPSGASVVAAPHAGVADRTDVFAVDAGGTLWNFTVVAGAYGTSAMGTGAGFAPPGTCVAVTQPPGTTDQTAVFVVSSEETLCQFLSTGAGAWSDPPAYLGPVLL